MNHGTEEHEAGDGDDLMGESPEERTRDSVQNGSRTPLTPTPATAPPSSVPTVNTSVKEEPDTDKDPQAVHLGESSANPKTIVHDVWILPMDAINALKLIRPTLTACVEAERTRVDMAIFGVGKTVSTIRRRLDEERGRLKCIQRKVAEKSEIHERAAKEFQRAQNVLDAATFDETIPPTVEEKAAMKAFTDLCAHLVQSWLANSGAAYSRLQSWEFKLKMQSDRVTGLEVDLSAAVATMHENRETLEKSLIYLQALSTVLANL